MDKSCRKKLMPVLQSLFGERRTECEYAKILFLGAEKKVVTKRQQDLGMSTQTVALKTAQIRFSQLMNNGRAIEGVLKSLKKVVSMTWYDEDFANADELSLDVLLEAVDRQERIRADHFVGTFEKIADAIVRACTTRNESKERNVKLLKFLWNSERLLLSRSSRISFGTMNRIAVAVERAAKVTADVFPSVDFPLLDECVRRTRSAALAKMGPSWNRCLAEADATVIRGRMQLFSRRREVLDLYARLSGRQIDPVVRALFCGQEHQPSRDLQKSR